jgi:uncharacterized membrane protein
VPIGAWTVTILLDLIALIFDVPGLGLAAGIATGLGVLAALATIAAGLMDWMDVDPREKAVGLTHRILNTFATFLFAFSFLMRSESHWRPMLSSFLVALAGYVVVSGGAYLGGAMVYHMGVTIAMLTARAQMIFFRFSALLICWKGSHTGSRSVGSPSCFCDLARESTRLVRFARTMVRLSKRARYRATRSSVPGTFPVLLLPTAASAKGPPARRCLLTRSASSKIKWRSSCGGKTSFHLNIRATGCLRQKRSWFSRGLGFLHPTQIFRFEFF